jgi:hypothetical protein
MSDVSFNPKRADDGQKVGQHSPSGRANGFAPQARIVDVATEAMEAAWEEALRRLDGAPLDPLPLWTKLATRVLTAVGNGERDPQRLKQIALAALDAQR